MSYKAYNKLVRDRIPEKIISGGETPHTRVLSQEEYDKLIKEKLVEEAREVVDATSKDKIIEELADCLEVLLSIARCYDIDWRDVSLAQEQKREKRGGFDQKIFLEGVDEHE